MKLKKPLKRLPSPGNGVRRKSGSFGAFSFQKAELRAIAHSQGMTVSYYVNKQLWADWLQGQETRVAKKGRKK